MSSYEHIPDDGRVQVLTPYADGIARARAGTLSRKEFDQLCVERRPPKEAGERVQWMKVKFKGEERPSSIYFWADEYREDCGIPADLGDW